MDFEIPFFFYHQGRRLVTVSIELMRPVRNLGRVLDALESSGISVLGLTSWLPSGDSESVGFLMVVDTTGHGSDPGELVRKLSELPGVTNVRIWRSGIDGFAAMTPNGFPTFIGERVYVMPSVVFKSIYTLFTGATERPSSSSFTLQERQRARGQPSSNPSSWIRRWNRSSRWSRSSRCSVLRWAS